MERRTFLSAAAFTAIAATPRAAPDSARVREAGPLVDTNVTLSHWPVRHSWAATPADLARRLRQHGVTEAWCGSFDGVLHTDLAGANARLGEACRRDGDGILQPVGTVNPLFPDWEEDVRRCRDVHGMKSVRIFPSYHGYTLEEPRFAELLERCARAGLLVQIPLVLEDERSHNPVLSAGGVPPAPLADLLPRIGGARVMLLNAGARMLTGNPALLTRLVAAGAWFDIATLEGIAGVEGVLQRSPDVRLTFGSHSPYFYFEAALLKLQESALTAAQLAAIRFGHARAALGAA